jgi:SAM-dependent methyltransferase
MSEYRDASTELGASAFHKATGIAAAQRRTELEFREKFVDSVSGKIHGHFVTHRNCPVCGGTGGDVSFTKNGFDHVLCDCGMVYVPELLKSEHLNLVYSGGEHERETHDGFRAEPRRTFICEIYKAGLDLIEKTAPGNRECLDVGCSSGLFMEYANERGYATEGIEPSDYAVEYGRKLGLNITKSYFTAETMGDRKFSLVTLWDVLEHCDDPKVILRDIHKVLDTEGAVFIQVPNVAGIAPRMLRERCNMFNGYAHINLFNPETLRKLLMDVGYKEPTFRSVISEISVVNNYLDYSDPYFGPSSGKEKVLGCISPEYIEANLLGYKLQVVARK